MGKPGIQHTAERIARQQARAAHARSVAAERRKGREPSKFTHLSAQQKMFVIYYTASFNVTQSAIRAGYSERTAAVIGHTLLKTVKIQAAIQERLRNATASADAVLARVTDIAFNDPLRFYSDTGELDYAKLKAEGGHLVNEFDASEGLKAARVKFQSQLQALLALGKHHGLFIERTEVSGPSGGPVAHVLEVPQDLMDKFKPKSTQPQPQPQPPEAPKSSIAGDNVS